MSDFYGDAELDEKVSLEAAAARIVVGQYRRALVEALLPLEILHGIGNSYRHPFLRWSYDCLISPALRQQIASAVKQGREALEIERKP